MDITDNGIEHVDMSDSITKAISILIDSVWDAILNRIFHVFYLWYKFDFVTP